MSNSSLPSNEANSISGQKKEVDFDSPLKSLSIPRPQFVLTETSLQETLRLMKSSHIGSILVVDEKVQLQGILTERDFLLKFWGTDLDMNQPVEKLMTKRPKTLTLDDPIHAAIKDMVKGNYRHIPIVNQCNSPVGIISIKDIVGHIYNSLWPN